MREYDVFSLFYELGDCSLLSISFAGDLMTKPKAMLWKALLMTLPALLVEAGQVEDVKFRRLQSTPLGSPAWLAYRSDVTSLLQCAKVCTSHFRCWCRGYEYHRSAGVCRVSTSTLTEDSGAATRSRSADIQYYTADFVLGGFGSPCATSGDCDCFFGSECVNEVCKCPLNYNYNPTSRQCEPEKILRQECSANAVLQSVPETLCQDGVCCKMGYHLHISSKTCHAKCPNGYGDTYYMAKQWQCIDGNNNVTDWSGKNLDQCWQFCKANPQCRSFEHASDRCYLSYNTVLEVPCNWKSCPDMTYYQRNCA